VKAVLDGLKVECPDCGIVITRDRLINHRDNVCPLPCARACGATVPRSAAAAHKPVCPLVAVSCDAAEYGCPWKGTLHEQAAHIPACGLRDVLPALRLLGGRIDAQAQHIQSLKRENAAQVQRIASLESQLARHTTPLKWHTLGDMFCVANGVKLDNGWVPYSNSLSFRFAKDAHGIVHLGGLIKSGLPDANKAVLTLPVGFRCPRWEHVSANGGCEFGEVLIRHSGDIYVRTKGRANDWISFDGISFSTV